MTDRTQDGELPEVDFSNFVLSLAATAMVQLGTNQTWAVQKVPPHDSVFLMFSPHKH